MRVYIAGSLKQSQRVAKLARRLRAAGHEITMEWWDSDGEPLDDVHPIDFREGVRQADALLLCWSAHAFGAIVEVGMAMAWEKEVIVLEDHTIRASTFWQMPGVRRVHTEEQALLCLDGKRVEALES